MTLGGVIYLLSIADRMKGTTRRNLDTFHRLCGDKALSKVVLGTTKWGEVDEGIGEMREQELADTFWSPMTAAGSKMLRFDRTERSARAFLKTILDQLEFGEIGKTNDNVLQIQNEIVDLDRKIPETTAGTEMRYTLEQLREFDILKDEANFEKKAALLESMEKQMEKPLPGPRPRPRKFYFKFIKNFINL